MDYRNNYSLDQWAQIISNAESSGLRRKDWLELNGISKDQYYYWKTRLRKLDGKESSLEVVAPKDSSLVSVPIPKESKHIKCSEFQPAAVIHLGNISVEISGDAPYGLIENIGRMIHNAL